MKIALLFAFAALPLSHGPRLPGRAAKASRPFFVAGMTRLIPQRDLDYNTHETATPVLDQATTRMYVGTHDGLVRCRFHERTAWVRETGGSVLAAPLLDGDTLYVASASGKLFALNRITGEERWTVDVHEELTATPTLAEGRLFVVSSDESVTAIEAASGKSLWKYHRERPAGFTIRGNARPAVAHGLVYTAFADGTVAALRPQDGVVRWTRAVSGSGDYLDVDALAAPEDDRRIYAASARTGLLALDAQSGETVWTVPLPGANHLIVSRDRIYGSGRGALLAANRVSGARIWTFPIEGDRYATEAVDANGILLFAVDRGPLIALDAAMGKPRGVLDPGSGFSEAPLVVPGGAFIVSNTAALFSLGLMP